MMKKWFTNVLKWWKPLLGVLAFIGMIIWTSGVLTQKVAPDSLPHAPGFALPDNVSTYTMRLAPMTARIDVTGTVTSEETIQISARLSAYVQKVFAGAGQAVKKGDLLIKLDDRELHEQLAAAEAQSRQADSEYERTQQLFQSQAATQQALIAAESMQQSARAQVDQIKVMLSFTEIRSPIDGIVTDRRIEAGDLAQPGQVLLAVYNPEAMRLEAPVPVRLVDRLALGATVPVQLEVPATLITGRVSEIVSEIDPVSRTRRVKVRLEDSPTDILPGAFGRLYIDAAARDGLLAPVSAVYQVGQLEMVQVVQDERVVRRLVKTGPVQGDQVEILAGLSEGEIILMQPVMED